MRHYVSGVVLATATAPNVPVSTAFLVGTAETTNSRSNTFKHGTDTVNEFDNSNVVALSILYRLDAAIMVPVEEIVSVNVFAVDVVLKNPTLNE